MPLILKHNNNRLKDGFGRHINYLRLSVTDLCNLRCNYCMPAEGIKKLAHNEVLRHHEFVAVAEAAVSLGLTKIRITGGEPLVKKSIVTLTQKLGAIDGLETLAMTTNATLLEPVAQDLFDAGVRRLNISLDTLNEERYRSLTVRGTLEDALRGISAAQNAGFHIKLNTVITHRDIDDYNAIISLARREGLGLRFIEEMSFAGNGKYIQEDELVSELGRVRQVQVCKTSPGDLHVRYYTVDGQRIGFISPRSHNFCGSCNKLRLTPHGRLRFCLATEGHIDLRAILRAPHTDQDLVNAIKKAVQAKPHTGPWEDEERNMWRIGG